MPQNDVTMPPHAQVGSQNRDPEDGPDYVVAKHVAVLDEHPMAGSGADETTYCGPRELQMIADNNNRRVKQTGDATPIVIGHTEDGKDETDQPEIVGFATNFTVGPLFDTGRQALFADFHIRKKDKDRVNQFPRRSVELWPKRWEVDPISLLGATTPERDLGLLQLARKGEVVRVYQCDGEADPMVVRYSRRGDVIRYSRSLESDVCTPLFPGMTPLQYAASKKIPTCQCCDPECPCCKGKCKVEAGSVVHRTDMDDEEGTPMCSGCAQDALSTGIFRSGVSYKKQQPFKPKPQRKSRGTDMAGHSYPTPIRSTQPYRAPANGTPRRYAMGDGDTAPPDEATAKIVEAVLQSAPIQEMVANSKQVMEAIQEMQQAMQTGGQQGLPQGGEPDGDEQPPMDQGDDQDQDGSPNEQARWMHEPSEQGTAEAHDGPPEQYEMDDDDMADQYAADDYEMDDDEESSGVEPKQYGAYSSSTNTYIPRAGHMGGHHGGIHPGSKRRHSRATAGGERVKSQYELYLESLGQNDEKVKYSRLEKTVEQQAAQLRELALDKVRYARAEHLRTLQIAEGIDMDVVEELTDTLHLDDAQFAKHCEKMKVRYKRDLSAIQPVRLAQTGNPQGMAAEPPENRMNHEQKIKFSRDVSEKMTAIRKKEPELSESELYTRARSEVLGRAG